MTALHSAPPSQRTSVLKPVCSITIPTDPSLSPPQLFSDSGMGSSVSYPDDYVPDLSATEVDSRSALLRLSAQYLSSEEALSPSDDVPSDLDDSDSNSVLSTSSELVPCKAVRIQINRPGAPQMVVLPKLGHHPPSASASVPELSPNSPASSSPVTPHDQESCPPPNPPNPAQLAGAIADLSLARQVSEDPATDIEKEEDLAFLTSNNPVSSLDSATVDGTATILLPSPVGSFTDLRHSTYCTRTENPSSDRVRLPAPSRENKPPSSAHSRALSTHAAKAVSKLKNRASMAAALRFPNKARQHSTSSTFNLSSLPFPSDGPVDTGAFSSSVSNFDTPSPSTGHMSTISSPNLLRNNPPAGARSHLTGPSVPDFGASLAPPPLPSARHSRSGFGRFRKVSKSILAAVSLSGSHQAKPVEVPCPPVSPQKPSHARRLSHSFSSALRLQTTNQSSRPPSSASRFDPSALHDRRSSVTNLSSIFGQRRESKHTSGHNTVHVSPRRGRDGALHSRAATLASRSSSFMGVSQASFHCPVDTPMSSSQASMVNLFGSLDTFATPSLARPSTSSPSLATALPPRTHSALNPAASPRSGSNSISSSVIPTLSPPHPVLGTNRLSVADDGSKRASTYSCGARSVSSPTALDSMAPYPSSHTSVGIFYRPI